MTYTGKIIDDTGKIKTDVLPEGGGDGKSAYEVAVDNGFTGTEQEWLASLHGEQGIKGDDGDPGSPGVKGDPGYTPIKDVDYFDGEQGPQGNPGLDADVTEHESTYNHGNYNTAYSHSQLTHAPPTAQINSDITKGEIEAKLTGEISTHSHAGGGGLSQAQVLTRML